MPLPDIIPLNQLGEPFYIGSVQRLYGIPSDPTHMVTETTNRGSVFDVGSIFDIQGSDVSRAVFRHMLYSRMAQPELWQQVKKSILAAPELDPAYRDELLTGTLEDLIQNGAHTHHAGMIDAVTGQVSQTGVPANPSNFNVVRRYQICKPTHMQVLGAWVYDYAMLRNQDGYVVPLEYIVRFGITGASSVFKKYLTMNEGARKAYEVELGVTKPLEAWQLLEKPISDCTTKYEPEDRNISKQEALTLCGLTGEQFGHSLKLAVLGAWAVRCLLEDVGLLLWDIKWEFAKDGDALVFVDTIDTDSFRATRFLEDDGKKLITHFNKQSMRDYYRLIHGDWMGAVEDAKKRAKAEGADFTELLAAGQKKGAYAQTPVVNETFLGIQVRKMEVIRDYMLQRLEAAPAGAALEECGRSELAFYREAGKLAEFVKLNAV